MIRCHDCGRQLTAREAVRRNVEVARRRTTGVGGLGDHLGLVFLGSRETARVDLCRACDEAREERIRRDHEAAPRRVRQAVLAAFVILLIATFIVVAGAIAGMGLARH